MSGKLPSPHIFQLNLPFKAYSKSWNFIHITKVIQYEQGVTLFTLRQTTRKHLDNRKKTQWHVCTSVQLVS